MIERPLAPHLQIYRWQITMVLSIVHRTTGVFMSIGIVLLVTWLLTAAQGPEAYTIFRDVMASPPGLFVIAGIVFSFCFHLCNGIRHLAWDTGAGFEKRQYHATGWMVVIGSSLLTVIVLALGAGIIGGGA